MIPCLRALRAAVGEKFPYPFTENATRRETSRPQGKPPPPLESSRGPSSPRFPYPFAENVGGVQVISPWRIARRPRSFPVESNIISFSSEDVGAASRSQLVSPRRTSKMAANVGESTSSGSSGDAAGGSFECNICFELPQEPIVTLCGHLFCWPCLYRWLHIHAHSPECPVCKAVVEEDKLVPLYGRGKDRVDPRSRNMPEADIPHRPAGQRPATAQQADPNNNFANANANPWFTGTGVPLTNARWGNYAFSTAFGGLFPMLSFQVHGFPDATAYAQPAGFHYGYGHGHGFHGGHMGHAHAVPRHGPLGQQQQADIYLKALLFMVGVLVIASLLAF